MYPVVAPALILVGTMMMAGVGSIDWSDPTESIPAFLTIVIMPLAVSITDGIAFGFIAYAILKVSTGRASEVHWLVYLFAVLFVLRYAFLVR
jgi:AGZA family xanthine/uracil permease-like MFS transporter